MKIDLDLAGARLPAPDYATFVATLRAIQAATPTAARNAPLADRPSTAPGTAPFADLGEERHGTAWRRGCFHRSGLGDGGQR